MSGRHWLGTWLQDARVAARMLTRNRGFAVVATLVLGLGLGVNNMMFTLIYAHTLRGLPVAERDRVLMGSFRDDRASEALVSWPEFEEVRGQLTGFAQIAAVGATVPVALGDAGRAPDRYNATYVTASAFDTLGIGMSLGRSFTLDEERHADTAVALLGHGAWTARYAADSSILGREVLINGRPTAIVGVLPDRSGFPSTAEVWLPAAHAPGASIANRQARSLRVFGRVRPGYSVQEATAQLETRLAAAAAASKPDQLLRPYVTPISDRFFGRPTDPAWIAFITAGFLVVLVSCANVANLMVARGVQRRREMAIRGSLGASRPRLFAQLMTESSVIAVAGTGVGLVLSLAFVRVFRSGVPPEALPYWLHYSMDATVLAALVAVAMCTTLVFGVLPAFQASATDVVRALRDSGWTGTRRTSAQRWTTVFMTVQIALAVILLAQGIRNWLDETEPPAADKAVTAPGVLTASISLAGDRYRSAEQRADFFRTVADRIRQLPGVAAVSLTTTLPRGGAVEQRLQLAPGRATEVERLPSVLTLSIAPHYFEALRVPLLQGREFDDTDTRPAPANVVVNRRFAESFFAGQDAVGRSVSVIDPRSRQARTVTIVGVSDDITQRVRARVVGESYAADPTLYFPLSVTAPTAVNLLVRGTVDAKTMTAALRDAVVAIDPNLPVFRAMTLVRAIEEAGWNTRVSVRLITTLIVIVLGLSGVGLYAATSHAVYQQTKELALRIAVGARPRQLVALVVHRATVQIALGLTFGILGTMAWAAAFSSGRVTPVAAPDLLVAIAAVLLVIMAAACVLPIRHALRVDPITALRQDA